jgi:hypothetical protein
MNNACGVRVERHEGLWPIRQRNFAAENCGRYEKRYLNTIQQTRFLEVKRYGMRVADCSSDVLV